MKKLQGTIAGLVIAAALCAQPASAMTANCFKEYWGSVWTCAELGTWGLRSVCGLDSAVDLASCLRRASKG